MADIQNLYAAVTILATFFFARWWLNPLRAIPTVGGPSAPGLSYLAALNFLRNSKELLIEGYEKFQGTTFKVALLDQWLVVVNGPELVDEIRKHPDLSANEGLDELFQMKHTLSPDALGGDSFQIGIVRDQLTRSLTAVLPDVVDELSVAFRDYIPTPGDDWVTLNALDAMQKIIARASNRVFVGLPICRNEEYLSIAIAFTLHVAQDRIVVNQFPTFMKPLVSTWFSRARHGIRRTVPMLKAEIDDRKAKMEEYGADWTDKPKDVLQWILEEAIPRNLSDESIVMRLHLVNFAAIHTSSNSLVHALYDLTAFPEYIPPIREEVESVIAVDGWTKAAMGKMWKLDSLLRESQRVHGIGLTAVTRKVMADVTLRDGTFLPKDTLVTADAWATHHDEDNYENASVFDPFRFARMREAAGEGTKHQFVSTSVDYIPFGHGSHACPGRFFASNELKAILAYLLLNYDIKLAGEGGRPENFCSAAIIMPNPEGEIMFRRRKVEGSVL